MLTIDTTTGRFTQGFAVALTGSDIVFQFQDENAVRHNPEGTLDFVDFANLVRHIPNRSFTSLDIGMDDWPMPESDVEYSAAPSDLLLDFAAISGPLFGHTCAVQENNTVAEPIESWLAAAKVLNFAVRADSLTGKPERVIENSLDGDVVYKVSVGASSELFGHGQIVAAIKNFGTVLPKPYSSMLKLNDEQRSKLARCVPYGDAIVHGEWDCNESYTAYAFIELPDNSGTKPASRVLTGEDFRRTDTMATDEEMNYEQMLAETLVQQLVSVHLVRTYVGWGVFYNDKLDRDMGTLGVQFNNYLERLWYTFGLHHAGGKLGICRHCGKLFSADKERKSTKIYCSKACQEAEKDERAKARRKRKRRLEAEAAKRSTAS